MKVEFWSLLFVFVITTSASWLAVSARATGGIPLCNRDATEPLDVVVVGAGLAGLTAAKTLRDHGKSFIVVERLSRVGGRVRSLDETEHGLAPRGDFAGILDAGASWMNGGRGRSLGRAQPIKTLADTYNVQYYDHSYTEVQMFEGKKELRWSRVNKALQGADSAWGCLVDEGHALYEAYYAGTPLFESESAADTLRVDCGWTPDTQVEKVMEEYYFTSEFLLLTDELSKFGFTDAVFADYGQGDNFVSDQVTGIQGIPQAYSDDFLTPGIDLFLSTKVEFIEYASDNTAVTVTVTDERDVTCKIEAGRVIYTPSIGILEKYKVSGFHPPINTDKLPLVSYYVVCWIDITAHFSLWTSDRIHVFIAFAFACFPKGHGNLDEGVFPIRQEVLVGGAPMDLTGNDQEHVQDLVKLRLLLEPVDQTLARQSHFGVRHG